MQYDKVVELKDGNGCLLRSCNENDASAVLEIFNRTHAETDNLLTYAEENHFTVEGEAAFLKEKSESEKSIEIGAFIDGILVGFAGVDPVGDQMKIRHRAEFGISVEKAHWGKGVGKALTEAAIECAKRAGFSQLELEVLAENENAVRLYRSCGFTEYGSNPRGFRTKNGDYQTLLLMRLVLD